MSTAYKLTPEHEAQLEPWAQRWIANAMTTRQMDAHDKRMMKGAITGLYEAAGLKPPPPDRIIFVESPFIARFAAGFAAWKWHVHKEGKSKGNAKEAKPMAEPKKKRAPKAMAEEPAPYVPLTEAQVEAMSEEELNKLRQPAEWFWFGGDMVALANELGVGRAGLECARNAWQMWQGGNQWSPWVAYVSFFRHVVKLEIDYSKWDHWEKAAIHGGPRMMHEEFCIVSDFPKTLTVDDANEPHSDTGPFCEWRDGSKLYSVHGVQVPGWVIERPELITIKAIKACQNAEERRIMRERFGEGRYLAKTGAKTIDFDSVPTDLQSVTAPGITRALIEDDEGDRYLVGSDGSTKRVYYMRVPNNTSTCAEAYLALTEGRKSKVVLQG